MSYASGNASAPAAAPILDPNASNIPSWVFTNSQVAVDTLGLALIALAVFSLGSLPRVIPRLYHRTSWADGWVLRWYDPTRPAIVRQSVFQRMTPVPPRRSTLKREDFLQGTEMKHLTPSISEKSDASSSKISRSDTVHSRLGAQQILPPVHFPSWSSLLHPVSTWLAFPNFGLSRGALTILIIYALWNIIFLFIFSNVVTNLKRAGFISVAQYPIAFALGSKNSLVGLLVGRSYEKLNYLHRWV